ncbi:glycosyltransferase family 2 protein [Halococcus saccharolyticus]|uniref:Glycosyl transferase n=1 Tax=Halococcus saccharolyticus DSM 5350 TaxID=1227455 RepID=M0MHZ5_9EURY|nr:glycosyltransferase [Halococcus saccharolyticus]EMA45326.1 glycosyl transferase [Halococcus saccharolyticus DSM 5350]
MCPPSPDGSSAASTLDGPLVSVVIPTYYRNDRLGGAIESVIDQDHPTETIVVDDSGEGHAEPVVDEFDVTSLELDRNRGSNPARTMGAERATGKYVQFLDDDDRLLPGKFARQVDLLERTDAGVAYCGMTYEDGRTVLPDSTVRGDVLESALAFAMSPCVTSTMLTDREVLDHVLPLPDRPGGDDLGLMIDLARRTSFEFVDDSLVRRGLIDDSRGKSPGLIRGRLEIVREYDDLYREASPGVRADALANTYRLEGRMALRDRRWSGAAVRSFARACYHAPSIRTAVPLGASLFGQPGMNAMQRVYQLVR